MLLLYFSIFIHSITYSTIAFDVISSGTDDQPMLNEFIDDKSMMDLFLEYDETFFKEVPIVTDEWSWIYDPWFANLPNENTLEDIETKANVISEKGDTVQPLIKELIASELKTDSNINSTISFKWRKEIRITIQKIFSGKTQIQKRKLKAKLILKISGLKERYKNQTYKNRVLDYIGQQIWNSS